MNFDGITIGEKSPEFERQTAGLRLTRALLAGTPAMRKAGERYLPRKKAEDRESYEARLQGAVLLNQYARTGGYLAGQIFQKPVRFQEPGEGAERGGPERVFWDRFAEDVDGQGSNLSIFANGVFRSGVDDGVVFILADYSAVAIEQDETGTPYVVRPDGRRERKTRDMDRREGWRPYWVHVKADQVLDCVVETRGGARVVTHFRYLETSREQAADGAATTLFRVRSFTPGAWETWSRRDTEAEFTREGGGALQAEPGNTLSGVPVVWFMPGHAATHVTAAPAMRDLAEMNVSHWQAYADHVQLMGWVRSPVWFGRNLRNTEGEPVPFGPGRLVAVDEGSGGPEAALANVGIDPASVEKSFDDLKVKEDYMALYGLQMVTQNTGAMTATQAGIAAAASDSQLKEWAHKLADCLENALRLVALWKGYADGPAVAVNTEFRIAFDAALLTLVSNMAEKGQISVRTLLETMKLMGVFADEFSVAAELERGGVMRVSEGALPPHTNR